MDQSLDEVCQNLQMFDSLVKLTFFFHHFQIISSRPKGRGIRRGGGRRSSARAQVLGTAATPAGRARAAAVAPTTVATATARPAAATNAIAEKIMVSNLPQDVNEAQIKLFSNLTTESAKNTDFISRNCSTQPLVL
jgi:hypothetical protein